MLREGLKKEMVALLPLYFDKISFISNMTVNNSEMGSHSA